MNTLWAAGKTQGGREYQEDFYAVLNSEGIYYQNKIYPITDGVIQTNQTLLVLADGMGGMGHGDLAARIIIEQFLEQFMNSQLAHLNTEDSFMASLEAANQAITDKVSENPSEFSGMGATLMALLWDESTRRVSWLSVGDSLMFALQGKAFSKVNDTHTWGNKIDELRAMGNDIPDERLEQISGALCSAVDGKDIEFIDVNIDALELKDNDFMMLASDGVETLPLNQIEKLLQQTKDDLTKQTSVENQKDVLDATVDTFFQEIAFIGRRNQDNASLMLLTPAAITKNKFKKLFSKAMS